MVIVAVMLFLVAIVATVGGIYYEVQMTKSKTAAKLGRATGHLEDELADAKADRDRLLRRVEALEAIVTSEGYDLEREARAAGLAPGRIDAGLLDDSAPPEPSEPEPVVQRQRTR
ncbi:hypothetical protein [Rubrivirga litoralis]|uniref:Cell division protein FtsB n=1 Tax=Rubrivirga litoralis TaxID=3075598 RepID=A0ABU3BLK2_9BACT|nr:hypothetical protein [Rubrivirga sp. F394]MDT0630151.1 hypothetical protein [Rubrivirga sp. F394]